MLKKVIVILILLVVTLISESKEKELFIERYISEDTKLYNDSNNSLFIKHLYRNEKVFIIAEIDGDFFRIKTDDKREGVIAGQYLTDKFTKEIIGILVTYKKLEVYLDADMKEMFESTGENEEYKITRVVDMKNEKLFETEEEVFIKGEQNGYIYKNIISLKTKEESAQSIEDELSEEELEKSIEENLKETMR